VRKTARAAGATAHATWRGGGVSLDRIGASLSYLTCGTPPASTLPYLLRSPGAFFLLLAADRCSCALFLRLYVLNA